MHKLTLVAERDSDPARPFPFTEYRVLDCSESCSCDLLRSKFNVGMTASLSPMVQKYVDANNRVFQPRSDSRRGDILAPNCQMHEEAALRGNLPREHCRCGELYSPLSALEGKWKTKMSGASEDCRETWC